MFVRSYCCSTVSKRDLLITINTKNGPRKNPRTLEIIHRWSILNYNTANKCSSSLYENGNFIAGFDIIIIIIIISIIEQFKEGIIKCGYPADYCTANNKFFQGHRRQNNELFLLVPDHDLLYRCYSPFVILIHGGSFHSPWKINSFIHVLLRLLVFFFFSV